MRSLGNISFEVKRISPTYALEGACVPTSRGASNAVSWGWVENSQPQLLTSTNSSPGDTSPGLRRLQPQWPSAKPIETGKPSQFCCLLQLKG